MMRFSFNFVCQALKKNFFADDFPINSVKIDSRKIDVGDLFIAIDGNQADGHDYIPQAIERGAVAALVSKPVATQLPTIVVDDVLEALGCVAAQWRQQFNMSIAAVTGSCGKTTVKNMIASIVKAAHRQESCYVSPGNYNSISGLPLSLLQLNEQYQFAVLEMGMNRFGEIAKISHWAQPDVVAINNIALVHTEYVGDLEGVARAKGEIISGLSDVGIAVLCIDSPFFLRWRQLLKPTQHCISFGKSSGADVSLQAINVYFDKCEFTLKIGMNTTDITLPFSGEHNAMNATCAAAVAHALGIDMQYIKQGLEHMPAVPRRFQHLTGFNNSLLIDDGYNANPQAVKAAIDILHQYSGKKILVLGAMRELGKQERRLHAEVGAYAKAQGIDYLFAIGDLAKEAINAYGERGRFFSQRQQLVPALIPLLDEQTCVVIKGSFSMNMKEFVDALQQ